jgi:hypothetical protein
MPVLEWGMRARLESGHDPRQIVALAGLPSITELAKGLEFGSHACHE